VHELWLGASAAQISTKGGMLTPPAAVYIYACIYGRVQKKSLNGEWEACWGSGRLPLVSAFAPPAATYNIIGDITFS